MRFRQEAALLLYAGLYDTLGSFELARLKWTFDIGCYYNLWVQSYFRDEHLDLEALRKQMKLAPLILGLLDSFADVVPRDLWITGMEERDSVLKLTGSAFSTTAVSDLMSNLRSSGRFKSIDIVISRQDLAKSPSMVTFEVTSNAPASLRDVFESGRSSSRSTNSILAQANWYSDSRSSSPVMRAFAMMRMRCRT